MFGIALIIMLSSLLDNVFGISFLHSYESRISKSSYTFLSIVFIVNFGSQVFLILLVARMRHSTKIFKTKLLNYLSILMLISMALLGSISFLLVNDMFHSNQYDPSLLTLITMYELTISLTIVGTLIGTLYFWFKRRTNSTVLLYLIAFLMFFLTTLSGFITLVQELQGRNLPVSPEPNPWDISSIRKSFLYDVYRVSSLVSFGLIWLATSLLLKNYSKSYKNKIGKGKYWLLVSLPLIYYLISNDLILNSLVTFIHQYPFLRNLIIYSFAATKQVGGLFFALAFIFMSRNVENINLKFYLMLSAVGILLLFSSLQITVLYLLPYPPFGLATLSIMPMSYYLVLIGLYYSARSISYDKQFLAKLGTHIRNEPDLFLDGIGSVEWSKNLESTVSQIMKHSTKQEEGVNSALSTEDIRDYVLEVVKEIKEKRGS